MQMLRAQINVRGWYAKGQVWIVWKTTSPEPDTYEIYESNNMRAESLYIIYCILYKEPSTVNCL